MRNPERNVTGLSTINLDLMSKYVELLRAAVPRLSRVTVLVNRNNPTHANYLKRIRAAEKAHDVKCRRSP